MARTNPLDDARRPCPACGQPIHTVAGRCKHCRTDLVKLREQRARVQKVDPSVLAAAAAATAQPAASPFAPPTNGTAPPVMMPTLEAVPPPNGHDLNAPPAYATYPDAAPPRSAWARSWPTLVVVLAGIAIAVCGYLLLVDGESQAAGSTKRRGVSPAPDRMETMPTPQPTPHAAPTPRTAPPSTPDPAPPVAPPADPTDPWGTPPNPPANPPPSAPRSAVPSADEFYPTMMHALCDKLKACGGLAGGASADDLCEMMLDPQAIDVLKQQSAGGQCRYDEQKAMACLRSIDSISCQGGDLSGILGGFSGLVDCSRALDCS